MNSIYPHLSHSGQNLYQIQLMVHLLFAHKKLKWAPQGEDTLHFSSQQVKFFPSLLPSQVAGKLQNNQARVKQHLGKIDLLSSVHQGPLLSCNLRAESRWMMSRTQDKKNFHLHPPNGSGRQDRMKSKAIQKDNVPHILDVL